MSDEHDQEQQMRDFVAANPEWADDIDLVPFPPGPDELAEEYPEVDSDLLEHCMEVVNPGVTRGAFYMHMRRKGESHSMADMLALQRPMGLDTDDVFFSGSKPLLEQFESERALKRNIAGAKRHGFTPPMNSTYFPNLARFPNDPEAYVTRAQGRGYIRKLLDKRGWACEGGVKAEHREPEYDPLEAAPALAPGLVAEKARAMVEKDPALRKLKRQELRERVLDKHGPST